MLGDNWYFGLTRKYISYFGYMFNDIYIDRTLNDGSLGARMKVPIAYSPKEQVLVRLRDDPGIDRKAQIVLPTMAFEITSMTYNKERKLPAVNKITAKSGDANRLKYTYVPVPYDIGITLYVLVKNAEDGAKIIEQVMPKFTPAISMQLELVPEMDITQAIPIVFNNIEPIASYKDEKYTELVAYIWTLQFTIQGYYYGPVKQNPVIKFSTATFYADGEFTTPFFSDTQSPGLTANGEPTSNVSLSIDPNLIWIDDDWGYTEVTNTHPYEILDGIDRVTRATIGIAEGTSNALAFSVNVGSSTGSSIGATTVSGVGSSTAAAPGAVVGISSVSGVGATMDTSALAFLSAASITDNTITNATNTLVTSLKSAGVWNKMKAIYPFVGGSASRHKLNLKDPRDLDVAYRLSFAGSWTHSSTGITGDGSTSYADTHFVPTTNFTSNTNASLGVYNRFNISSGTTPYDMGSSDGTDQKAVLVISKYSNGKAFFGLGTTSYSVSLTVADARGLFVANRPNDTDTEGYQNGSSIISLADEADFSTFPIYIGASNRGGTPSYFSNKNWAFAFIGDSMNSTEQTALYNAVQAFQTTLGRQV